MPTPKDYLQAIRYAEDHFATLTHLRPVMNPKFADEPSYRSGNFALVFAMQYPETGEKAAIKCFIRKQQGREQRYKAVSLYLKANPSPYFVPYDFLTDELWADDQENPVLRMDWVEGETLGQHLRACCEAEDRAALQQLYDRFREMALWLHLQPLAHGDIKPDNVMVRPNGTLALVDYDGMFVPDLAGERPTEAGTRPFTHPKRGDRHFDRHLDDFSLLLHLTALRALCLEPSLYASFCSEDRLFFTNDDLEDLRNSEAMRQLLLIFDDRLNRMLAHLKEASEQPLQAIKTLPDLCEPRLNEPEALRELYLDLWVKQLPQYLEEVSTPKLLTEEELREMPVYCDLEEALKEPEKVYRLDLSKQGLTSLPESIGKLTKLQTLGLGWNQLTFLPESIGKLTKLQTLKLYHNNLTSLPESIGKLTELQTLDLGWSQLTFLPESIGKLNSLRGLDLRNNQLTALPESIGKLNSLRGLDLRNNQLTALPESIGQLANLQELNLRVNKLTTLPESIGQLKNLKMLNVWWNPIANNPPKWLKDLLDKMQPPENEVDSLPF